MKRLILNILTISIVLFSCQSEQDKKDEENQKSVQRKSELTENIKEDFIKKYNPIHDWDTIHFDYTYDYKKLFIDTIINKFVLIEGEINDFDISNDGISHFFLTQGYSPSINFMTKCTKSQFEYLYQNKKNEGVFIVKLERIDKVWYDLEVDNEDISQTFSNDLIAIDSLIDYKIIK